MGNDPGNSVDPSGGWGYPATAGLVGFGGTIANAGGAGFNISSAVASWVGIAVKAISLTQQATIVVQGVTQYEAIDELLSQVLTKTGPSFGPGVLGTLGLVTVLSVIPEVDTWGKTHREFPKGESPDDKAKEKSRLKVFYATYTKTARDGTVYSGRTSGLYKGDEPTTEDAIEAVNSREAKHHIKGYRSAVLDKFSTSAEAIRGREQQLIDFHGGAQNEGGYSGNPIR
jgi:hypothetical protein